MADRITNPCVSFSTEYPIPFGILASVDLAFGVEAPEKINQLKKNHKNNEFKMLINYSIIKKYTNDLPGCSPHFRVTMLGQGKHFPYQRIPRKM